ncbi:MAG: hypothetical protein A2821_03480 [Candidatus Magasanikbacteria bacterium RIFCSPHIGHO2_01_FULL_41_23]|uniref:Glutamate-1-semialdehyde 2,1-aminomutase n=1 Tax=Candidatus Magasanikbacteria bacterium RIFCSPLOWO2_01_FULL_40_15 TaxID=1798686 RepID=A0A1F6N1I0_9BACT|nr:MAG: hypothetical protein A2821_03480 [Candidatus Magasanikbacteria bacterium RIFCSPHIGHO2_01_FULL_41_23]OGH66612.1 MAG: hypothetical protein A3C66_03060 [Candidatus Magasanikbacteria bacterium RIFCSPHIGHO2_02_FULL_41_35]OGH74765.1 MAG: hypothetical protein A3F22_00845 [Candidatus Magasanikbacteria bacterium RIFCSPHIGHO2_12_FULL_41_16]OGH77741.1 MAG: hypothetical protein A2983_03820 [Candidatus Magasanikbacteria bacterium RIFCSPLOWO2_01_FULL_40_15]
MSVLNKNQLSALLKRRHDLIPGGAHTYSKGDDQFPSNAPKAAVKGRGAYVWCEDGKKYLDWCMGLRSVSLGHVYPAVNKAVKVQMDQGTNFGRPHLTEFLLADRITKLLPGVEMVKFAKNGSTVTTAATKLARAYTGRKYIAVCKSQPFFSYDDWFIGTTDCGAGIPAEIKKLTLTFEYNNYASLETLFKEYPDQIACVILEPVTMVEPKDNFLKKIEILTKKNKAVFIIDEMITGFRFDLLGAVKIYDLKPDLVTYGKGIANGYSLAVLGGKKEIMERGGIQHNKERVFLISTTHGAETTAIAAALATIDEMQKKKVQEHFWKIGDQIKTGMEKLIKKYDLTGLIEVVGFAPNLFMNFRDTDGAISFVLKTIFLQETIKRGLLFQGAFPLSYSHKSAEVVKTLKVMDEVMAVYKKVLADKNRNKYLVGEAIKPVFRKFN